ncbi:MAG TPA: type II and III secretion system protein family protein [Aestuariivirgaceae bacterium]|nr:type II and III secretion system protein family protein [Aestuariivirgaceae bacterium]
MVGKRNRTGRLLALAVLAAGLLVGGGLVTPATVKANSAQLGETGGHFVRIGLNKSKVVTLPGPARDVLVGNPEIVEVVVRTQNTAYLFARAPGQSNAYFFDADGRQILALDIEVTQDMAALHQLIQRTIPGSQITVDTIGENVVLGGVAKSAAEAKTALDLAARFAGGEEKVMSTVAITGRDQVMLRVRVAEVQRDVLKAFGVDFDQLVAKAGNFTVNAFTFNPFTLGTGLASGATVNPSYEKGDTKVDAVIQAMERDGLVRTLAEPTLTAISGESAKFLAGGEFPVRTGTNCSDGGNFCTATVEYKPFGVGLGFTPVVLSEGRISLRISTEVSELSQENAVGETPSLKVRRAETTVELPSGGSMVMAGLIQERTRQDINGVPGLKDLPVLGTLFRSRDFQSNQTELVVIVTPFVVDAVNDRHLATPLDRLNIATDRQTILFGRLHKVYGIAGHAPKGGYQGSVGFIVE